MSASSPDPASQPWAYKDFVRDALTRVPELSCEELRARMPSRPRILDIREHDEMAGGVLPGAIQLSRGLLEKHVGEHLPDRTGAVVLYCATGNRSAIAADVLLKMGYREVYNLAGGIERWRHLGLPVAGGSAHARGSHVQVSDASGSTHETAAAATDGVRGWDEVRNEFAIIGRATPVLGSGERTLVYLDHAATTHAPRTVLREYVEFLEHQYANIHRGTHLLSRRATQRFDDCYHVVADFIGAELERGCVCFTSNATQAIDLVAHIMAERPGKIVTTEMEHHSNELPHRRRGTVLRARVLDDGSLDLEHLEQLVRRNEIKLVCVTAGSNVTGLMPELRAIARLAHENGALLMVDAAQALSRLPIDVLPFDDPEHIDFLVGVGHKAYAPFGAGFLYGPRDLMDAAPPYIPGGGTATDVTARSADYLPAPDRHQGGTPNIAGVVALSHALRFLSSIGREEIRRHEMTLLDRIFRGLEQLGGITIYGPADPSRRLGVVSFNVEGASDLLTAAVLSEECAVAVRNGRFCAHVYVDRLLATHHPNASERPTGAVRASVGLYTDEQDIDRLLEAVARVRRKEWVGRYRMRGDVMNAEFAGRCADRWMEAQSPEETSGSDGPCAAMSREESGVASVRTEASVEPDLGYVFETLQLDGACRTYLIADDTTGEAALIDPLKDEVGVYLDLLQARGLKLRYTIETHTHADHISGSALLKERTGAEMLMHAASSSICLDRGLEDGDVIALGSLRLDVIATPGHTIDAISLVLPGRVLTGDTLLIGSCGRTDLPTGDARELFHSIRRLMDLPESTRVFPAHDYDGRLASTIGQERARNPKCSLPDAESFAEVMAKMELPLPPGLEEVLGANRECK